MKSVLKKHSVAVVARGRERVLHRLDHDAFAESSTRLRVPQEEDVNDKS